MPETQKTLGLYIHIPFCKKKCDYCDFYSLPDAEDQMDRYLQALSAHLAEIAPRAAGMAVDTVYFGGGTPSLLGEKRLCALLKTIRKRYPVARDAEITLEANPESAGDEKTLGILRKAGFSRLSLGMQSASDRELQSVGRIHSFQQVRLAVQAARRAGFDNISLDLIYGLPGQTMDSWRETLVSAVSLLPRHLSCYGLKVEEGTPLFVRRERESLPGDELQAEMYLLAVEFLRRMGYRQYEISNFAQPGYESRHNLKYWTLGEYAGFGPGAHSDLGDVRYAFVRDLEDYIRGVEEGIPMLTENDLIPPMDRDTEWLMLGLRTAAGISPQAFETRFRRRFGCFLPFLERCRRAGYALEEDGRWHLTPEGFLVSNQIIGEMLDILAEDKRRQEESTAQGDYHVRAH